MRLGINLFIGFLFIIYACSIPVHSKKDVAVILEEIKAERDALLSTWYPTIIDNKLGGYISNLEFDWSLSSDQPKMIVTQARGLWTAARAAQILGDDRYKDYAHHGFEYLTNSMWDKNLEGFFQLRNDSVGESLNYKMAYGNAFALYAISEYAKINTAPSVLEWVKTAFNWLEEHAHEPVHLGYYNIIPDAKDSLNDQLSSWGKNEWKDQNSSIHLMEAFSQTYQVWPVQPVRDRLEEMLILVRDKMTHPDGYLRLFFEKDWTPITYQDSSRKFILENSNHDHKSFGHDIETAYLLIEASEILYGKVDEQTLLVAKKLVDHSLEHGFDTAYYGIFDRGYRFDPSGPIEIIRNNKVWWAQAEACHALLLIYQYFPEEKYFRAFLKMWDYIKSELIDSEYGGWYPDGLDVDPKNSQKKKANIWKGPYHDGRALMQMVEILEKM